MMRKIICLFILIIPFKSPKNIFGTIRVVSSEKADLISKINFNSENAILPSPSLLEKALNGYEKLRILGKIHLENTLTIIDYSLPSTQKRIWVLDILAGKIIYYSYVAHGKNSGEDCAQWFSNNLGSLQSSLGFFITGETYIGKHGLSLFLDGQEKDINDLARKRAIVVHGASYVSEGFIKQHGYLGRSFGCPALPENMSNEIIQTIAGGSVLFIYAADQNYISRSQYL